MDICKKDEILIKEDANANSQSNIIDKDAWWNLDIYHSMRKGYFSSDEVHYLEMNCDDSK